jgi:hypothetical protein
MLEYIKEVFYDNCDIYNTVNNISSTCGNSMVYTEHTCYPECMAALLTVTHTCKYLFIRAGLYAGVIDILKSCGELASN